MVDKLQNVKGTRDIIFEEAEKFIHIIDTARRISKSYGYSEAILPTLEYYELFAKKSGYEINKRMYVFEDLSKRKIALRPELTPSVARVFINKLQQLPKPLRISYFANVFRYDEPQKARYREFWQAGFEHLGSQSVLADIEIVNMCYDIFSALGIEKVQLKVGHMGLIKELLKIGGVRDLELPYFLYLIDKKNFDELKRKISSYEKGLEVYEILLNLSNLKGDNIMDEAKKYLKYEPLLKHLENFYIFISYLNSINLKNYSIDLSFARGIEYYTGVIYEYYVPNLNVSVGGGGRYDLLIEYYGGFHTPATGCALGIDRIALIQNIKVNYQKILCIIYSLNINEKLIQFLFKIVSELKEVNCIVNIDTTNHSLKEALSEASKKKANYFLIIGEKELRKNVVIVRDMLTKNQYEVDLSKLKEWFLNNVRSRI